MKREDEIWKVINEVSKPKEERIWTLKEEEREITDKKEIAEIFNKFFIKKIEELKDNIDPNQIRDPIRKLKEKVKFKYLKFNLKTVSENKVKKVMDSMKR